MARLIACCAMPISSCCGKSCFLSSVFDPESVSRNTVDRQQHCAAALGDRPQFENLIGEGEESAEAATKDGRTPLFYAIESGQTDLAHQLLKYGISINGKSTLRRSPREQETPLTVSGRGCHMKIFQELVDTGSLPANARSDNDGETPLASIA